MRSFVLFLLLVISSVAQGQQLLVVKIAEGQHLAFEIAVDGHHKLIGTYRSVTVIDSDPTPPPQPNAWKVAGGLHVVVVDDENLRGNLPQSQINLLSSLPFRQWLDSNAKGYRFSSNDSLVAGSEARDLELPVWVEGWDLLMKSDKDLPLWIIGNGRQTVIEPLPLTVDAAIRRLEGLR